MHNLIFRSHGKCYDAVILIFSVSFDLENMCTVAKLSLLQFFLLNYHIIYILGKLWAQM